MDKNEYYQLFDRINAPLLKHFSADKARINFGHTGVLYGTEIAGVEGFARLLWGLGPAFTVEAARRKYGPTIIAGITAGADPQAPGYWGELTDGDQRMVEMPAIALALMSGDRWLWRQLSQTTHDQLYAWFDQINHHQCGIGNWQFFRVLVNLVLNQLGYPMNHEEVAASLARIQACAREDGWYQDSPRGRRDYYTAFAFHYYGLIYSTLVPDAPEAPLFRQRATAFGHQFVHFFDADGANLAFGRSMIYRYAAVAFWTAAVYAGITPYPLAVMKGIIERNLAWWLKQPIFDDNGMLTLGYTYPQLGMTEPYNAPLSPYWSNKVFLLLRLPEDHPYWHTEAAPLPTFDQPTLLPDIGMIADHYPHETQVISAGQIGPDYHTHVAEKYLKFAYSTHFGFSIPRGSQSLGEMALDSTLGVQRQDITYPASSGQAITDIREDVAPLIARDRIEAVAVSDDYVASTWRPMAGVCVRTWLLPIAGGHIRIHHLQTTQAIVVYETGFAIQRDAGTTAQATSYTGTCGFSGIESLLGEARVAKTVTAYPNTNLMTASATIIPGLWGEYQPGDYWFATLVAANADAAIGEQAWHSACHVTIKADQIDLSMLGHNVTIPMEEA